VVERLSDADKVSGPDGIFPRESAVGIGIEKERALRETTL